MSDNSFANADAALVRLSHRILEDGLEVGSRAGRVKELLHQNITIEEPWRREILTPGRKASLPAQIAETMWVLSGRNDVEWLSAYLPRAKDFSDDGETWRGGYGPRIREWDPEEAQAPFYGDQLKFVVDLLKRDRATRRAVVQIYNPTIDSADGKDIPCNDMLVFTSRLGYLDLSVHTRSNDLIWGWSGINQFEWSALLEIVAGMLGLYVGVLHFNIVSLHMYDRHWQRASTFETPGMHLGLNDSPRFYLEPQNRTVETLDKLIGEWFALEDKARRGELGTNEIDVFPEPMLRSWLYVIAWWWSKDDRFLLPLPPASRLEAAARLTPQPKPKVEKPDISDPLTFAFATAKLHEEKSAAYGDSWKRRGEMLGIMANIARKIDRLGKTDSNETAADTATDLLVYLIKYRLWLADACISPVPECVATKAAPYSDDPTYVTAYLIQLADANARCPRGIDLEATLTTQFSRLETRVTEKLDRTLMVNTMIQYAWELAYRLWQKEQVRLSGNPYRNIR